MNPRLQNVSRKGAKHVLSNAEGHAKVGEYKMIFLCALGVLAGETFLKLFSQIF
jgi:hypothetical protein